MSTLKDLGAVVTYRVLQRPGERTTYYSPWFGGPSFDLGYRARRIWRRGGVPTVTPEWKRDSGWSGRRVVVDLVTGRAVLHKNEYTVDYVQISFWRDVVGHIRVGRQGAPPADDLHDLTALRRLAGMPA